MSRLDELAAERIRHMERLQAIDDEAATLLQNQEEKLHQARKHWPHLGPHAPANLPAVPKVRISDLKL